MFLWVNRLSPCFWRLVGHLLQMMISVLLEGFVQHKCEPGHEKMYLISYANNKGEDQPAHPRSLISAFVVRCLDSIISLNSIASYCGCAGRFVSVLVGNSRRHVLTCRGSCAFSFFFLQFLRECWFFLSLCELLWAETWQNQQSDCAPSEDSDWANAQADLSLRWAHIHFVGFVMSRLISFTNCEWYFAA